jgi:hypothetical protein
MADYRLEDLKVDHRKQIELFDDRVFESKVREVKMYSGMFQCLLCSCVDWRKIKGRLGWLNK